MNENLLKSPDISFVELNNIRIAEIKDLSPVNSSQTKSFDWSIELYIG